MAIESLEHTGSPYGPINFEQSIGKDMTPDNFCIFSAEMTGIIS